MYFRLVLQEHPDKGGDADKFKEITKAYEILSDPEKRELYDAHGEKGVESGAPASGPQDFMDALFGGGARRRPTKGDPTMHPLRVGLQDLYKGKTVRLAVTREIFEEDPEGPLRTRDGKRFSRRNEREVLTVHIERGMKDGQKITFEGKGDKPPGLDAGDVVFVVKEKEHPVFQRRGGDLVMKKEISLVEALTGVDFTVTHLDGHKIRVRSKPGEVLAHESVRQLKDEGMPIHGHTYMRGCMFVNIEVKWPETLDLTEAQKSALRGILPGPTGSGDVNALDKDDAAADDDEEEAYVEDKELEEPDMEARAARERLAREAQSDSDEQPGVQRVQCPQQ